MALRRHPEPAPLRQVVERDYPRDLAGLEAQLVDADADVRRRAAGDLAQFAEAAPVLSRRLAIEPDRSVREAILTSLLAHPDARAVTVLVELLRSEDAGLRNAAIEALSAMPQLIGNHIAALLADPDSDVRILTVNLLAELRHPKLIQWLLQVLANEQHINVVAAAIDVLAEVGGPAEVPALREVAQRFQGNEFIAFVADLAIGRNTRS